MLRKIDITKLQAESLKTAQLRKNDAEHKLNEAAGMLELITSLVLDAHGIDSSIRKFDVDLKNLQIIVEIPEQKHPLEKIRERSTDIFENEIG